MSFTGPFDRKTILIDRIADAITSTDDLEKPTGSRTNDSLERLAVYFEEHGGIPGASGVVQADWNATSGPAAILNKPTMRELLDALEEDDGTFDDVVGVTTASSDDIDSLFG